MASLYDLGTAGILLAIAGTAITAIVWGLFLARRFPLEAFQLRLFHNLNRLSNGLRAVDVAVLLLVAAFLPGVLGIQTPEAWGLLFSALAAAAIWYGLFEFARTFRIVRRRQRTTAEEEKRGSP